MATIGLDKLYYSKITEDASGNETYETPKTLAKAVSAELSVELAEATLFADDVAAEIVKEFKSGTLTLGVDDIGVGMAADLTGAQIDKNNVLIFMFDNTTNVSNRIKSLELLSDETVEQIVKSYYCFKNNDKSELSYRLFINQLFKCINIESPKTIVKNERIIIGSGGFCSGK